MVLTSEARARDQQLTTKVDIARIQSVFARKALRYMSHVPASP